MVRVTITIRRESHPEWYDRLVDVESGRARAEIVRSHLMLPRAVSISRRSLSRSGQNENAPATTQHDELSATRKTENSLIDSTNLETVNFSETKEINSLNTVNFSTPKEINSLNTVNFSETKEINSISQEPTPTKGSPNMASLLLGKLGSDAQFLNK